MYPSRNRFQICYLRGFFEIARWCISTTPMESARYSRTVRLAAGCLAVLTFCVVSKAEPIRYVVKIPQPLTHYAEVEATFPAGPRSFEVFLPVWTPGSYLVREFARNIEDFRVISAGATLGGKTRKNRWRIDADEGQPVVIKYRLYCREMSVRTNWIDENFALLNGAAAFVTDVNRKGSEYEVKLELPSGWRTAISGMPAAGVNGFQASDYDTLVDSPILAGNPALHEFQVAGVPHVLVNQGEGPLWDGARATGDTQKIVEQNLRMWGSLPYSRYVFLNLIVDAGGGIEHKNSFTIMTSRYATRTRKAYLDWLGLVSHEYFHAWNVKRLRPVELGPFDYENETYTRSLWIAEGFTEYYSGLNVRRAGLATDAEYLGAGPPNEVWPASLSSLIESLQTTPGRLVQPIEAASYDAWIKLYRPDENTPNTAISYYVKGALVAWLLDAKIRQVTGDSKTLDDLMRAAYAKYSGEHGYSVDEFVALASDVAGTDLQAWLRRILESTEELDYRDALDWFGLEFKPPEPPKKDGHPKAWTGIETRTDGGRLIVRSVRRDTPGYKAGLSADDEILAVDGYRVTPDQWAQRLEQYAPGAQIELLASRRDRILRVPLTLEAEPPKRWQLQVSSKATPEQKAHFASWTTGASRALSQSQR